MFTRKQIGTVLNACLLLLVVSACTPESSTFAEDRNACNLLDAEDIASVLTGLVSVGKRDDLGLITEGNQAGAYSSTCFWQLDRTQGATEYVILLAMLWPEDKPATIFLDEFRSSAESGVIPQDPVPLSLGEESMWWGDGVAVVKGNISFGISTRLEGEKQDRRSTAEALGKMIVSRLQ